MNPVSKPATETVMACWGDKAPAWVMTLAGYCDSVSQAKAAAKIKYSPAVVNKVLKNTYTGDMQAVQDSVETAFKGAITCPVLGAIDGAECLDWQSKPYCGANHHLVRMYRACRNCPLRQKGKNA